MSHATITLLVLAATVVLFVWNRWPVEVVAVGSALALYGTGVLDINQALAGFGDAAVVFIAALFVVSEGLDATGVTTWAGQVLARRGGDRRLLVLTMLLSAGLTALIGLNGAVASLLPMVVVMAMGRSMSPSRLLMPLAFAGSAGGLLALTGSPVNVVISEAARDAGVGSFGFAEFAVAGIPLVAGTVFVVLALGRRLLPERASDMLPPDLSEHARTLVEEYGLDRLVHVRATAATSLLGRPRGRWDLAGYPGLRVVTVREAGARRPISMGALTVGDRVTLAGDAAQARRFAADQGFELEGVRDADEVRRDLLSRQSGAAEVVIPPRSRYVGRTVAASAVLGNGLVVLAVNRRGSDVGSEPVDLLAGDALLLEGPWRALDEAEADHDVLVVNSPDLIRRQTVPLGPRSTRAIAVLAGMVGLLATGAVPAVVAGLLAAGAMILLRVVTVHQAYRGISWTTVLLVAGMIPMATAIRTSGAGDDIARIIVDGVGGSGPIVLLVALFVITVTFGQLISNMATALIMIPIAVSAANQLGVSARPVLMSLCVAAAVAVLTPIATPANMMVMGPGGYRFGDYWRLGLPIVGVFFVVSVGLVPLVWRF